MNLAKYCYISAEIIAKVDDLFFEQTAELDTQLSFPDKLRVVLGIIPLNKVKIKNPAGKLEVGAKVGVLLIRGDTIHKLKRRVRQYAYRNKKKFDFEVRGNQVWITRVR